MVDDEDDVNESLLKVFMKYGVAGVVAGVLLWVFISDVRADQRATRTEHLKFREEFLAVKDIAAQGDHSQQQILWILQTMCVNSARNEAMRADCLRKVGK